MQNLSFGATYTITVTSSQQPSMQPSLQQSMQPLSEPSMQPGRQPSIRPTKLTYHSAYYNSKSFANALIKRGYKLVGGGTETIKTTA